VLTKKKNFYENSTVRRYGADSKKCLSALFSRTRTQRD